MIYIKKVSNERLALHVIKPQFPDWPEAQLMFAVIRQAVVDLTKKNLRIEAARFIQGNLYYAELCGLDPQWIRETLVKCGVKLP